MVSLDTVINEVTVANQSACVNTVRTELLVAAVTATTPSITFGSLCEDGDTKAALIAGFGEDISQGVQTANSACFDTYLEAVVDKIIERKDLVCSVVSSSASVTVGLSALAVIALRLL